MIQKSILNIAHRGFTRSFPDNTLNAFEDAIQIGVDGVECDIRETSDHGFIIFHEEILMGNQVIDLELDQIKKFKYEGGYSIATLEETLELCRGRTKLMLDIKDLVSIQEFYRLVTSLFDPLELMIGSFHHSLISQMTGLDKQVKKGIILESLASTPSSVLNEAQVHFLSVDYQLLDDKLVNEIHSSGGEIFVWNVTSEAQIRNTVSLEVDGIISDYPDIVNKILPRL